MSDYRIVAFRPEHLAPALSLFVAAYRKERVRNPVLASAKEIAGVVRPLLADLVRRFPACAILRDGEFSGYMTGIPGLRKFKGNEDGAFIPEWAHAAAIGPDRITLYSKLYACLAEQWGCSGNYTHAVSILAHDSELQKYWFRHTFGLEVIDAMIRSAPLVPPQIPGLRIVRAAKPRELAALIQMRHELQKYLFCAPIQLPILKLPDAQALMADEQQEVFIAYHQGCPAGYMMARTDDSGVAAIIGGANSLSINGIFVRDRFRRFGIATALLRKVIESGTAQGITRVGVDFHSANDRAYCFLHRYFQPVCHSLVRHIDTRRTELVMKDMASPEEVGEIAERAIRWAMPLVGKSGYAGRCLAFVEDAIEQANSLEIFGGDCAAESADIYEAGNADASPPRGALVFYDWEGPLHGKVRNWGHVGLALEDGKILHAWDRVRIDDCRAVEKLPVPPDSSPLRYRGWAPLERVLLGMQRR